MSSRTAALKQVPHAAPVNGEYYHHAILCTVGKALAAQLCSFPPLDQALGISDEINLAPAPTFAVGTAACPYVVERGNQNYALCQGKPRCLHQMQLVEIHAKQTGQPDWLTRKPWGAR